MIKNVYARRAFLWFCFFGIIGVFLDADHLPALFGAGAAFSALFGVSALEMGRPLHTLAVIYSGSFFCVFGTLGYGLLFSNCILAGLSRHLQMRKYRNSDYSSGTLVPLSSDQIDL